MIIRSLVCAAQMTFPDISRCARRTAHQPPAVGGDYKWTVQLAACSGRSYTFTGSQFMLHMSRDYISGKHGVSLPAHQEPG